MVLSQLGLSRELVALEPVWLSGLHPSAAVERNGAALLLSGPSGRGKSTLATLLCEHGWRLMSDDIAPLRMNNDQVLPFYQSPLRRINPGREVHIDDIGSLEREAVHRPGPSP